MISTDVQGTRISRVIKITYLQGSLTVKVWMQSKNHEIGRDLMCFMLYFSFGSFKPSSYRISVEVLSIECPDGQWYRK